MKTKIITSALILVVTPETTSTNSLPNTVNYIIGSVIALYLLGYLFYSFLKREEF
jgi:hypothetical protein